MRLNDALIANEKYRGEPTTDEEGKAQWPSCILWDDDLQGFGVRIYPPVRGRPSRKDFIVTWKVGLRTRTMAIGTFGPGCSLRQARKMARDAIDLARRGQDPIEARHRALGIGTPEDLASRFLFEHNAARKKPGIPGGEPAAVASPESSPDAATPAADVVSSAAEPASDPAGASAGGGAELLPPAEPVKAAASPVPAPVAEQLASPADLSIEDVESPLDEPAEDEPADAEPAAAPAEPAPSRFVQMPRRPLPPPPPPVKRGPTKVRLLPVPESLYRVIEHGARESGMTIAAYLNALVEIARAAVGEDQRGRSAASEGGPPLEETGPSVRELFAQVQEAQVVKVGGSNDALEDEPGSR